MKAQPQLLTVIASPATPGVAIQMDCFVAVLLAMTGERK